MNRQASAWAAGLAAGLGIAMAGGGAMAQPAFAQGGGTDITADRLEMIDAQHLAIYSGAVEAVQTSARLTCDVLNVYFDGKPGGGAPKAAAPAGPGALGQAGGQDWGSVQKLVADGHVFYVTQTQTMRGEHAVYDLDADVITMTGDVVVVQGDNVVKGDKLVIQVKTGHTDIVSNATGRNKPDRVRGVFYNNNNQAQSAPAAAKGGKP